MPSVREDEPSLLSLRGNIPRFLVWSSDHV